VLRCKSSPLLAFTFAAWNVTSNFREPGNDEIKVVKKRLADLRKELAEVQVWCPHCGWTPSGGEDA
jgi:hypothetical protein